MERIERMIAEAFQTRRPVLVNPTADEIRRVADDLRREGKLMCTACREPIHDAEYESRRITLAPKCEAIAHLHSECARELDAEEPDAESPDTLEQA